MASFLDKVKVTTAVTKFNKFDLSCDHITTTDWMHLAPIYNKEMVPKEKLSVNTEAMARLAPLAVPTFGRGNINLRAYFVPYRTIFPAWNDFITDVRHTPYNVSSSVNNSLMVTSVPTVTNAALRRLFVGDQGESDLNGYASLDRSAPAIYDYKFVDDSDNFVYVTLQPKGRRVMKIIESLGYKIQWKTFSTADEPTYSALPILAYAKVYIDWYWPQAYSDHLSDVEQLFKQDSSTTLSLSVTQLRTIFSICDLVCYDTDYFTAAFDNPTGPNSGAWSAVSIPDISSTTGSVVSTTNADNPTPLLRNSSNPGNSGKVSQYLIDALHSLTDYMKRHQIAGAKALDRFFARFGVALAPEKLNRSVYIGSKLVPIQIGDVTSTSDNTATSGSNADPYGYDRLAAFAGRGVGYGQGNFDFETDEYGMFIICSSIMPAVGYYQGIDRSILHTNKLDFWTPEFDALGTQAIAASELCVPIDGALFEDTNLNQAVFGFTPRYAEYKIAKDKVTGDYRYDTMNHSLMTNNGWHFMRQFPDTVLEYNDAVEGNAGGSAFGDWYIHSKEFVQGRDALQFNRIFQSYGSQENYADHFSVIYHFDIGMVAPMRKLFDTYDFEDEDNKKDVTLDVNGVKMN